MIKEVNYFCEDFILEGEEEYQQPNQTLSESLQFLLQCREDLEQLQEIFESTGTSFLEDGTLLQIEGSYGKIRIPLEKIDEVDCESGATSIGNSKLSLNFYPSHSINFALEKRETDQNIGLEV